MHIDLLRDVIFIIIILSIFSYFFTKKGVEAGNRTVRLVIGAIGSSFLILFLFLVGLMASGKMGGDYKNAILPLSAILFMAVLFLSIAIFKKDFSSHFKSQEKIDSRLRANKKLNIMIWALGIAVVICGKIALQTYNLFFLTSFFIICVILFVLSIILSR